jgi:hypothetical protein
LALGIEGSAAWALCSVRFLRAEPGELEPAGGHRGAEPFGRRVRPCVPAIGRLALRPSKVLYMFPERETADRARREIIRAAFRPSIWESSILIGQQGNE